MEHNGIETDFGKLIELLRTVPLDEARTTRVLEAVVKELSLTLLLVTRLTARKASLMHFVVIDRHGTEIKTMKKPNDAKQEEGHASFDAVKEVEAHNARQVSQRNLERLLRADEVVKSGGAGSLDQLANIFPEDPEGGVLAYLALNQARKEGTICADFVAGDQRFRASPDKAAPTALSGAPTSLVNCLATFDFERDAVSLHPAVPHAGTRRYPVRATAVSWETDLGRRLDFARVIGLKFNASGRFVASIHSDDYLFDIDRITWDETEAIKAIQDYLQSIFGRKIQLDLF